MDELSIDNITSLAKKLNTVDPALIVSALINKYLADENFKAWFIDKHCEFILETDLLDKSKVYEIKTGCQEKKW